MNNFGVSILTFSFFCSFSEAKNCSEKNIKDVLKLSANVIETLRNYHLTVSEFNRELKKNTLTSAEFTRMVENNSNASESSYFDALNSLKDLIKFNPECNILNIPDLKTK